MARLRSHEGLLARIILGALLCGCALGVAKLHAQISPSSYSPSLNPQPGVGPMTPGVAAPAPAERVLDIRVIGNRAITRDKVLSNIGTRIGQPFDQATFENDVRKLHGKNWFVGVNPQRDAVPGGVIITLEVLERPTLQYIEFHGNEKFRRSKLLKESGLKLKDPLDTYAVEEARRKIESLYQAKGFNDVRVTIFEGNKPGHRGAVFLIEEGKTQKVWKVHFEGNYLATDGRLQAAVVKQKPPILGLFKGKFDRKQVENDVELLTDYYHSLGYFKVRVGRDYVLNEKETWATINYYIEEGPRYRVRNVTFLGNDRYDDTVFREHLKLKPGDAFDKTRMNADEGTIKDMYGSNGFVFADATAKLVLFEEPGELDLVYQVSEGNQFTCSAVRVHIAGDNPHTRTLTAMNFVSQYPGDIIDITKIRNSEKKLKASTLFNLDPTKGDVPRITIAPPDTEEEGGPTRNIARQPGGSTSRGQSPDGNWGGQPLNPVAPGPRPYSANQPVPYNYAQPNGGYPPPGNYTAPPGNYAPPGGYAPPQGGYAAQPPGGYAPPPAGVVYPPGYGPPPPIYTPGQPLPPPDGSAPVFPGFGQPVMPEDVPPSTPVDIYLSETQTGRFMFGAGVNSNAGLVGNIVLDERNFDWRRVPTSWEDFRSGRAFRGAGQQFRIEAAPGTQVQRYMFSFVEPYLFDTPVSLGLSAFYYNRFFRDWTEQRTGGRVTWGYQFTPDLSGNIALRAEDVGISNPRVNTVPDLNAVLGHTQIYSVVGTMQHNTRDNPFLATEGHLIRLDFEYAMGSFQFPRFNFDVRQHFLLRERPDGSGRHVFSLYNQFGITGDDTPIYERYYAGGFSTLRGFSFRGASPVINNVQVGGDFQNLSTVEYLFPITADDMLRGVAFVDFGTVEPTANIDWRNFRVSPGLGLRVTIPAMGPAPIALDFAVPVQYAPTDIKQVFSFFVGFSR